VLPVGQADIARTTTVNIFCPKCQDIFFPKSSRQGSEFMFTKCLSVVTFVKHCPPPYVLWQTADIDGAYFGTTFPHLFLMTHTELIPPKPPTVYTPRCYGFKIAKESVYYGQGTSPSRQRRQPRKKGQR
jgi:casein kinase II subunit beta